MENKISWKALEYKQKEKTVDWYWAVGIISLAIVIISIYKHNIFFAALIIISTAILLSFSINKPRLIEINIDQKGITVDRDMYPFVTLQSFWIESMPGEDEKIILKSSKLLMPLIIIPLEEHHHLDVREFLLKYLKEEEMHEPFANKFMDKLGF